MSYFQGLGALTSAQQAERRALAAQVVTLTQKAAERIDYLLANQASLRSVMNRGLIFVPSAYEARQSLIRARKELFEKFRPIALAAIEDPSRNLPEILSSIKGYLYSLEQQQKIVIQVSETQNLSAAIEAKFKEVSKQVEEALDPTKSLIPWIAGGFGLVALVILIKK